MKKANNEQVMASENQALDLYLGSLYNDSPAMGEGGGCPAPVTPVDGADEIEDGTKDPVDENRTGAHEGSVTLSEGMESPHKNPMKVLLFNLCGLKMAISMDDLDDIEKLPENLAAVPKNMPLYLGLLQTGNRRIPVVDLARLILPERLREQHNSSSFQQILIVGGHHWGLACNEVGEVATIDASMVNWRIERKTRKWLAGTIGSFGSALLDTVALQYLLKQGEK